VCRQVLLAGERLGAALTCALERPLLEVYTRHVLVQVHLLREVECTLATLEGSDVLVEAAFQVSSQVIDS
jgi:hypothetical protein